MHTTKTKSASFLFLGLGIFMFFFALVPTSVEAGIIVCGDCCQEPYEASGVYGDGPSGGSCYSTGNSWDYCDECVSRNSWGVCTAYEVYQGQASSPGCGGCAGVRCEYPAPTTYQLTTRVSPTGSGTITPSSRSYNSGTVVSVTKTAASGYVFTGWSGSCSGTGSCSVTMSTNRTVQANFALPPSTLSAGLTVSPTSGTTNTTFNFTTTVGGTATGTITYGTPSCGTGGSRLNWSGSSDNTFSCRYSSTGTKTATTYVARGGLNASATRSLTVGAISLTANLAVSPTSGTTADTYNFTTSVGGTATGTITYGSPSCGTGGLRTSWNGSTLFSCIYTSSGTKTATAPVSRQGLSASGTRSLTVGLAPTLFAGVTVSPTSGTTSTTFNFTTTVGGTATGTVTYGTPSCGTGGTLSNWSGSTDSTFSCRYSSGGSRTVSAPVTREGLTATATRNITVASITITGVNIAIDPRWIPRGGSTLVSWTTTPSSPGSTAECRVDGGPWIPYSVPNELPFAGIQQVRVFVVECRNDTPSSASSSETVYILPSFSEF